MSAWRRIGNTVFGGLVVLYQPVERLTGWYALRRRAKISDPLDSRRVSGGTHLRFASGKMSSAFCHLVLLLGLLVSGTAQAGDTVALPQPAKASQGEQCVEPIDFMRRNHMDLLKHQRDDTMRRGIRTKAYSWKGCVECHAATDPEVFGGQIRTLKPFCGTCHAYAAVSFDCIQCHTTIPEADQAKLRALQQRAASGDPAAQQELVLNEAHRRGQGAPRP